MVDIILVIGRKSDGSYGGFWGGHIDEGSDMEPHPTLEPGGGGGGEPPPYDYEHSAECSNANGAAAQVAETIMATDDMGPNLFTWRDAEYVATIVEKSPGVFGAYNNRLYSDGRTFQARQILPDASTKVVGLVHNHPAGTASRSFNAQELAQLRYPSSSLQEGQFDDWDALERVYEKFGSGIPGYDPSIWVTDSSGITRGFKRSERASFENMTPDQKQAGEGLDGREVENNCG